MAFAVINAAWMSVASVFAADISFNNTDGDYDLGNPNNWVGGALPSGSTGADINKVNTETNAFVLSSCSKVLPYQINLQTGPMWFDLGEGNEFVAANKFFINTTKKTFVVKSGILGVDFENASGDRFFMGDGGEGGNTLIVTGSTAVIQSSYKNRVQVGTNKGRQTLLVVDGATMKGSIVMGVNRSNDANTNNLFVVNNATHWVPSKVGSGAILTTGEDGSANTAIYTNHAQLVSECTGPIYLCFQQSHLRSRGKGKMIVADHSNLSMPKGTIYLGYGGDYNTLDVSGGSTVECSQLYLTQTVDIGVRTNDNRRFDYDYTVGVASHNHMTLSGSGTSFRTRSSAFVGGYSYDSRLFVKDGAMFGVADTLQVGGAGGTNTLLTVETNCVADVLNGFNIGAGSTAALDNRMVIDGGTFYFTNSVTAGRTAQISSGGVSNGMEFVNGAAGYFTSSNGVFYVGTGSSAGYWKAIDGFFRVKDGANVQVLDHNHFFVGAEYTADGNRIVVDNATMDIANRFFRGQIRLGSYGKNSLIEVTNGGRLSVSNMTFGISYNQAGVTNTLRVTNGSTMDLIINGSNEKEGFVVGNYGVGMFEVSNGSTFTMPHILRLTSGSANAFGSSAYISNGSTCIVYRVIMGESVAGGRLYVDNAYFQTGAYLGTTWKQGSLQLGTANANSHHHELHISGTNAQIYVSEGVSMAPDSTIQFNIGKDGLSQTKPVLKVAANISPYSSVTADHPATIRIVDDDARTTGGTYTLVQTINGNMDWSKFVIENNNPDITIVEQSTKKLVVRARNRLGITIIVK